MLQTSKCLKCQSKYWCTTHCFIFWHSKLNSIFCKESQNQSATSRKFQIMQNIHKNIGYIWKLPGISENTFRSINFFLLVDREGDSLFLHNQTTKHQNLLDKKVPPAPLIYCCHQTCNIVPAWRNMFCHQHTELLPPRD